MKAMTNLPAALFVGGLGTFCFAAAEMMLGVTVEWTDLAKYGGAVAGAIWFASREFQKIKDNQEAMQIAITRLCENQESSYRTAKQLIEAVNQLQSFFPPKRKTEFVAVDTPHKLP